MKSTTGVGFTGPMGKWPSPGLMITVFPQTSAGNIFQVGMASGKLKGVMRPHTPMGRR